MKPKKHVSKGMILKVAMVLAFTVLTAGCALVWTDNMLLITFMKDYNLEKGTSTSNKLKAEYKPLIELETKP